MSPLISAWILAFAATSAAELPIYALGLRKLGWGTALAAAAGVNCVTHPLLWFAAPRFSPYWAWVLVAEVLIIMAEALLLKWAVANRAEAPGFGALVGLSLVANVGSVVVGLALGLG